MSEKLKFATAVVYAEDVPATVAFYHRVTGLEPTYYDADLGFADSPYSARTRPWRSHHTTPGC